MSDAYIRENLGTYKHTCLQSLKGLNFVIKEWYEESCN